MMRLALLALFAVGSTAFADSIAIYRGRLASQEIYRHATAGTPSLRGYQQDTYAVVRLGAGGEIAFINYKKTKTGKTYAAMGSQFVSLNYVTNAEGTKGQCVLTRATTLGATPPPTTTVSNIWAEGPLMPSLKAAAKLDRNWTRVLSIETNYGFANLDGGTNDYFAFSKGFLILDEKLTKAANLANEGTPESHAAAVTRVVQLLQSKGYTAEGGG